MKELKEKLNQLEHFLKDDEVGSIAVTGKDIRDLLSSMEDGWVKCTDGLPDAEQEVIIYFKNIVGWHVVTAFWKNGQFNEFCERCNCCHPFGPTVTHWMPLPNNPTP